MSITPSDSRAPACSRARTSGFTLVEVALAALIISLGLLALAGLGRLALQNAKDAEDDTRAAWLADDVFNTLRASNDALCASNNPVAWAAFWTAFAAGTTNLPLSTMLGFTNQFDNGTFTVRGNGLESTNVFCSCGTPAITEWRARTSLDIQLVNAFAAMGLIDAAVAPPVNEMRVTLHVRPGTYAADVPARTFYTHFTEHGALP